MSVGTVIPVSLFYRTLLALGCHVGMGDEKAEENLKKIKLPKTYVNSDIATCFIILSLCISEYELVCPPAT